jgi:hypothetical protein
VFDIEPALQALESDPGAYLNAKQLEGVAATLEGALAVRAVATSAAQASGNGSGGGRSHGSGGGSTESSSSGARLLYPALAALAAPISPEEGVIARAVRHCIKVRGNWLIRMRCRRKHHMGLSMSGRQLWQYWHHLPCIH